MCPIRVYKIWVWQCCSAIVFVIILAYAFWIFYEDCLYKRNRLLQLEEGIADSELIPQNAPVEEQEAFLLEQQAAQAAFEKFMASIRRWEPVSSSPIPQRNHSGPHDETTDSSNERPRERVAPQSPEAA